MGCFDHVWTILISNWILGTLGVGVWVLLVDARQKMMFSISGEFWLLFEEFDYFDAVGDVFPYGEIVKVCSLHWDLS